MEERLFGRVTELFIPEDSYIDNYKVGFKVQVEDKLFTIEEKQTLENSKIYKDDFVYLNKTIIDNKETYTIEAIGDEEYE